MGDGVLLAANGPEDGRFEGENAAATVSDGRV